MTSISIAPWLSVRGATAAVDFYKAAFGADQLSRMEDDSEVVVAHLAIGGADFWLQEDPDSSPEVVDRRSVRMILTVDDPDSWFERAVGAGATEVAAVYEGHGWRIGRVADPFGHHWEIGRPLD
jgi:PhnB protein